jgi:hypothetical protein
MTNATISRRDFLLSVRNQDAQQLFPGLPSANKQRPQKVTEVHLARQAQTIVIYARRGSDLSTQLPSNMSATSGDHALFSGYLLGWRLVGFSRRPDSRHCAHELRADFAKAIRREVHPEVLLLAVGLNTPGLGERRKLPFRPSKPSYQSTCKARAFQRL